MRNLLIGIIVLLAVGGCSANTQTVRRPQVPPQAQFANGAPSDSLGVTYPSIQREIDRMRELPRSTSAPRLSQSTNDNSSDVESLRATVEAMRVEIDQLKASKPSTTERIKELRSYPPITGNVDVTPYGVSVTTDFNFIDTMVRGRHPEIQYYPETGGQKGVLNGGYVIMPAYVGRYDFDIIPNGTPARIEVLLDGVVISNWTHFFIGNTRWNNTLNVEVRVGTKRQYRLRTYHDDGHRRVLMSQVDRDSIVVFPIKFQVYCKNGL